LTRHERNPLLTSTFGTGQLIKDALETGITEVMLCIGGSATNDAGLGIAAALGYQFLDVHDQPVLPIGDNLSQIARIDRTNVLPALRRALIRVACDVKNPLYGPTGAAYVYAAQKGADERAQRKLDDGLRHVASLLDRNLGLLVADEPGSGAAGGVGLGLQQAIPISPPELSVAQAHQQAYTLLMEAVALTYPA
jgi:glycerate kinase